MPPHDKVAHVRGDFVSVMHNYNMILASERHAFKTSCNKTPHLHQGEYRSLRHIDWMVTVRRGKKNDRSFLAASCSRSIVTICVLAN